jgi:hypothetical protein
MRKFYPACQDNFVVVTLFWQLLKIACGGIFDLLSWQPSQPASSMLVFIWRNCHPGKWDLASFKQDLGNRAGPFAHIKPGKVIFTVKITTQWDLTYQASSLSGPARLPDKHLLSWYTSNFLWPQYKELLMN